MTTETCELLQYLGSLELRLPQRETINARTGFIFTRQTFPKLPCVLTTSALTINKTYHFYNDCYRADVLHFRASSRKTYRYLGLAILTVVFCPDLPELTIRLNSLESQIKTIKIQYPGSTGRSEFHYETEPRSFEYHPTEIDEYPWKGKKAPDFRSWPDFWLTYSGPDSWNHWEERDQIEGFGDDDASVLLAALLLNFGRDENKQTVVTLESPVGYGGVSKLSAEVRFHLSESDEWHPSTPR